MGQFDGTVHPIKSLFHLYNKPLYAPLVLVPRSLPNQGLASEAPYVAANVLLWPQVDVLFANPGRLVSLTSQQRAWLSQAVADAGKDAAAKLSAQDAVFARKDCAAGARFALATRGNLAALRRAFSSVYRRLERDPQTRTFIRRIEQLRSGTPALDWTSARL